MDSMMIALRIVHVGLGVFWAGTILFVAIFLEPSVRAVGPGGAPVMQQLMQRRFFNIMPVVALLTLVSGLWLYWRDSGGFAAEWLHSRAAMAFGAGGALAVIAFLVGMIIMRPATTRLFALSAQVQQAPPEQREAMMAELGVLRGRMKNAGRAVATLLALAVVAMAVARYV